MRFRTSILVFVLAISAASATAQQNTTTATGFIYVQGYDQKGANADVVYGRLKLWVNGPWGGHADIDAHKSGNEINQLMLTRTLGNQKFSVGRFLIADTWDTIPPHLVRTASARLAEGTLGAFFGDGFQYERADGSSDLMADVMTSVGQPFYSFRDTSRPAASLRWQLGKYGERYFAIGGRFEERGKHYASLDSGYQLGHAYFGGSVYYATHTPGKRPATGNAYAEYRVAPWLAPHILVDMPPLGSRTTSVGAGFGNLKYLYLAAERQFGQDKAGWALRATARINF